MIGNPDKIKPYQFQKGKTGNPNGRPKALPDLNKLIIKVLGEKKNGITAMEGIIQVLRGKALKGDTKAAELLLDRGYGKQKQEIDLGFSRQATAELFPYELTEGTPEAISGTEADSKPELTAPD